MKRNIKPARTGQLEGLSTIFPFRPFCAKIMCAIACVSLQCIGGRLIRSLRIVSVLGLLVVLVGVSPSASFGEAKTRRL